MIDFAKILKQYKRPSKSFSQAILPLKFASRSIISQMQKAERASLEVSVGSEKIKVLSALKDYVTPLLEQQGEKHITGGKIVCQQSNMSHGDVISFSPHYASWQEYLEALNKCQICRSTAYNSVIHEFTTAQLTPPLDILFISDRPRDIDFSLLGQEDAETSSAQEPLEKTCFQAEKAEMVQKMMDQIQPAPGKRALTLLTKCPAKAGTTNEDIWQECKSNLYHELYFLRPKVIVTFGAWSTKMLIGREDKISTLHGQFIPLTMKTPQTTLEFVVVPLFHPEIIFINKEMKRTTWVDMQKIISYLR